MNTQLRDFLYACVFMVLFFAVLGHASDACADEVDVKSWANGSEYVLYSLIVADMLQTRQIRDHDDLYEKTDWACGKNPDDGCIAAWFGAKLWGVWWLNHRSSLTHMRRYKTNVFLSAWTFTVVHSNYKLGLEVKF